MRTYFGAFALDSDLRQVTCEGREIHLTPKAFDLLTLLVADAGRVMTKKELHERLWPDTFVSDATLVGLIKMLRRTLGDHDARAPIIRTRHGVGYALVAPIVSHGQSQMVAPQSALVEDAPGVSGTRVHRVSIPEHAPRPDPYDLPIGLMITGDQTVAAQPSIAVLPFTDLSPQHDQAHLGEGIAEELIHALSAIEGLKVSARSSSFQFAGKAVNIRDAGAQLRVDTILEGSIRTADHRLRLTARLVNVSDGYQLWSDRYDRTLDDVFVVQDEMARAIAAKLQVTLSAGRVRSSLQRHTQDLEAYRLYLQGRYYWSRRVKGSMQLATACFERAIARDPSYALPYAGLADVYITLGMFGGLPACAASSKAKPAARQAIRLNDELGEAHHATACIDAFFEWDFVAAEREFRRAITLRPNSGITPSAFAYFLAILGRFEESSAEAIRALTLEPMSPLVRVHVAAAFFLARRFDEGLAECRSALEIDPGFALAYWAQAIVHTDLGRYDAALDIVQSALTSSWDFVPAAAGWIYAVAGQREKADEILTSLRARSPSESQFTMTFAWIALTHGEIDEAFVWLDRAYGDRNPLLLQIGAARRYDPLRDDARFKALLKKVGLNGVRPAP